MKKWPIIFLCFFASVSGGKAAWGTEYTGQCIETPPLGYTPNVTYTITIPQSSIAGPPVSCSATGTLTNPVNNDTDPTVSCSLTDEPGFMVLLNTTPIIKITGIDCGPYTQSELMAYGGGTNSPDVEVGIIAPSASEWNASNRVDNRSSSDWLVLFGPGGVISTSNVVDGTDHDGQTNSQIAFGGTSTTTGGSRTVVKVNVFGTQTQTGSDIDTLVLNFAPQP